jgi:hypothetical protein
VPSVATVPNATAELEDEAITIFREVAAECARPVLLFSGGKDSVVTLETLKAAGRTFDCLLLNPTQAAASLPIRPASISPLEAGLTTLRQHPRTSAAAS